MRRRSGVEHGVGVTGWAGPAAGEGGRIGTVFGAHATAHDVLCRRWQLDGGREEVRAAAVAELLSLLRERLEGSQDSGHG